MGRAFVPHTITSDSALGGSVIDHSLRFNRGDNPHLSRTPSSAGNRKVWTYSVWLKRTDFGARSFFQAYDGSSSRRFQLSFNGSDQINFNQGGNSSSGLANSYMTFRDPTAWYHIVGVADYSNSTAADRFKVYVNGSQISLNITDGIENADGQCNGAFEHEIGAIGSSGNVFDGYMADINFIDGQALDASYFGYTEFQTKVWRPKRYTGTYGNNGFKLDFRDFTSNSGNNIGYDYSGNQNNFSPDNFGGNTDGTTDSPTNNFCTFNKIMDYSLNADISEAGLRVQGPTSGHGDKRIFSPFSIPLTGKYYIEAKFVKNGARGTIGFTDGNPNGGSTGTNNPINFSFYGGGYSSTATRPNYSTLGDFSLNDFLVIALDMDAGRMWIKKNGNIDITAGEQINSIVRTNLDNTYRWYYQETSGDNSAVEWNFGQRPYNYTQPDGFQTMSTRNIQPTYFDATNQPAKTFLNPKKHFDVLTWTGNGSNGNAITGLEFQPDFIWGKCRSNGHDHQLIDSIRGTTKYLSSNRTDEATASDRITSINSNGFTLGSDARLNENSQTNVAWCWKAGGAAVSNSDGSITSSVSANQEAGFSVVSWTGSGADASIGHGLGKKPKVLFVKNRSAGDNWKVWFKGVTTDDSYSFQLDTSGANYSGSDKWYNSPNGNDTTTTTFGVSGDGATNRSGELFVSYCWADIPGFSKYGVYTGNGNSNGIFVHTGFSPIFIIYKKVAAENWHMLDIKRQSNNPNPTVIDPNRSAAETTDTNTQIDILSNGFKLRSSHGTSNASGSDYLYMAWADQPGITTYGSSPTAR